MNPIPHERCDKECCDVKLFAQKFQRWLTARGWECATFGAVVWHKGEHHIAIDPEIDILGAFAAAEGMDTEALKAEVEAMK